MSQETFSEMVSAMPTEILAVSGSIVKINEQMTALQLEINDIIEFASNPTSAASDVYLSTKSAELSASYGVTMTPCTSGGYGTTNLTEWIIVSGGTCTGPITSFWDPSSISASSSGADLDQYNRQLSYEEIYDHLYRDFEDEPIATYGIQANYDGLELGRDILIRDLAKLEEMYDIYSGL